MSYELVIMLEREQVTTKKNDDHSFGHCFGSGHDELEPGSYSARSRVYGMGRS